MGRFECDPHAEAAALYLDGEPEPRRCDECVNYKDSSEYCCSCGSVYAYCEAYGLVVDSEAEADDCERWETA